MIVNAVRLYSTPKSALEVETSALALIETLVAVAVSLWLAVYVLQDWSHVALGAILAPLTLLRTTASVRRGLDWMVFSWKWLDGCANRVAIALEHRVEPNWPKLCGSISVSFSLILVVSFYCLSFPCIRIAAIVTSMLTEPLTCIRGIPRNFTRACFATDFIHPPELVPGIETAEDMNEHRFSVFLREFRGLSNDCGSYPWFVFFGDATSGLVLFLAQSTTYLYRLSVKATAVVWLPLLWVILKTSSDDGLVLRLKLLARSSWGRLVSWLSAVALAALALKLIVYHGITSPSDILQRWVDVPLVRGVAIFAAEEFHELVVPFKIPPWQVVGACNSLLALFLYFYANHQIIRLEEGGEPARTDWIIRTGTAARATMSLYTIFCLLYIIVLLAGNWNWPPLGDKLFPWQ